MLAASLPKPRLLPPKLPPACALFLDFDGTLVELAERPDAVVASERVRAIVTRANSVLDGRVAIVTGREAAFIRDRLGLVGPGVCIAGSHGQELHFANGATRIPVAPASLIAVGDRLETEVLARPGVLVERKPLGVALHYRMAPEAEGWCNALAAELSEAHGLQRQPGKMMIELRAPGADKGEAIRQFLGEPGFAGTVPVFAGDDLTDEPAFEAAAALGGWGVLVGPERPTAARYRLDGVPDVLDWLERRLPA